MVEVLNYHEQVKVRTTNPSQSLDYNWFFNKFYKLPQSGTINRTHVLVAARLDGKTTSLRLRGHMDSTQGTQNPLGFKKERQ